MRDAHDTFSAATPLLRHKIWPCRRYIFCKFSRLRVIQLLDSFQRRRVVLHHATRENTSDCCTTCQRHVNTCTRWDQRQRYGSVTSMQCSSMTFPAKVTFACNSVIAELPQRFITRQLHDIGYVVVLTVQPSFVAMEVWGSLGELLALKVVLRRVGMVTGAPSATDTGTTAMLVLYADS